MIWSNCTRTKHWKLIWLLRVESGLSSCSVRSIWKSYKFWSLCMKYYWRLSSSEYSRENCWSRRSTEKLADPCIKNWSNCTGIWEHSTDSILIPSMCTPTLGKSILSCGKSSKTCKLSTLKRRLSLKLKNRKRRLSRSEDKIKERPMSTIIRNLSSEIWPTWLETFEPDKNCSEWESNIRKERPVVLNRVKCRSRSDA